MPTYHQIFRKPRIKKIHTNNVKALEGCPQKKGVCVKLRIVKPKKPNSAQRKVAKLRLSTRRMIIAYIPGQGHNLQEYSSVLVSGGRAPDLPGVRYTLIKGKYDFSWKESFDRKKKLSKYGYSTKKKINLVYRLITLFLVILDLRGGIFTEEDIFIENN